MPLDYTLPFALGLLATLVGLLSFLGLSLTRAAFFLLRRPAARLRRPITLSLLLAIVGAFASLLTLRMKGATIEHAATDIVMIQAPRPARVVTPPSPYLLLAGDLHCHVSPPDWSEHVARGLSDTIAIARAEGLDFISLMPHAFSRFHADAVKRAQVERLIGELRERVRARPADGLLIDIGIEYVDPTGHVGMVLGDITTALAAAPIDISRTRPAAFFDAFAEQGGILVVHHPLLTPIPTRLSLTSLDISWQPFTGRPPFLPEIAAVDARAEGFEAANLFVRAARDRFLLGDPEHSTRRILALLDQQIHQRARRMTPVGGTDSHSFHLRPMTFVLAEERSIAGVRDAIHAGRTCVVAPAACTLEARRAGDSAFHPVGSSLIDVTRLEARARGAAIVIVRDGQRVAAAADGEIVTIDVDPSRCTLIRATVDGGYSAPVYVNCPFAE